MIKSLCRWQSNAHLRPLIVRRYILPSIVLFPDAEELHLLELIDQEYTRHPFYGSRKIMHYLRNEGYQGAQFTSAAFIGALTEHPSISISMDWRGRALDNIFVERLWRSVKHEDIYLKGYATSAELQCGLKDYFVLVNVERTHQSLGYSTPDKVYRTAVGGSSRIVDKL